MENPQPDAAAPLEGTPGGVQPDQPVAPAEQTPSEPPTPTPSEEPVEGDDPTPPADNSGDDFDYEAWLQKKGIDPSTPEGQAAIAKSWRSLEQKMHQTTQQASELEKSVNDQPLAEVTTDPAVQDALSRAARVEMALTVERWKSQNGITPEQDKALGKYLVDNPQKAWLVKNGHLDLSDVYAMSGVGKVDTDALKRAGGKEALESLASKQRTTAPAGNASTQKPAPAEDPLLAVLKD